MQQIFHLDELDDTTRDYLRAVRARQGEGAPGVYVPLTSWLPLVGLILGVVIIACVLIFTLAPLDNPTGMALLQTAGLMLGGWLIVAAVRVWVGTGIGTNFGHFVYADAQRLWHVQGGKVAVTELDGLEVAVLTDNYNDGNYQSTAVEIGLSNGRHTLLTITNQAGAHQLVNYLNALVVTRAAPWAQSGASYQVGITAKGMALGFHGAPAGVAPDDPALGGSPVPERRPRPLAGVVACVVIVGIAVATIFVMNNINIVMRDHAIFDLLRQNAMPQPGRPWGDYKNAQYLRAYLLDPRNTRHVDEVKQILARHYAMPLEQIRRDAKDPELGRKFVEVVEGLKTATIPAVSIRVTERAAPDLAGRKEFSDEARAARAKTVREKIAEGLCGALGGDKPRLIEFVQVPDDEKVLLEVTYQFMPGKGEGLTDLQWTVSVRSRPNAEALVRPAPPEVAQAIGTLDERALHMARWISQALSGRDDRAEPFNDPMFPLNPPIVFNPGF